MCPNKFEDFPINKILTAMYSHDFLIPKLRPFVTLPSLYFRVVGRVADPDPCQLQDLEPDLYR